MGVTGDTHNNLKNISEICSIFNKNRTDLVFHTGDISLPKSLLAFKNLKCPLITVLGNNDIDEKEFLVHAAKEFDCKIFDEPYFSSLEGKKITVLHHPDIIDDQILSSSDLIFHGHTHRFRLEKLKNTIIFNPGECAGHMKGKNKVGLVELPAMKLKTISF